MQERAKVKNIKTISVPKCYQNRDYWQKDRIEGNIRLNLSDEKRNPEDTPQYWSY